MRYLVVVVLSGFVLAGCGSGEEPAPPPKPTVQAPAPTTPSAPRDPVKDTLDEAKKSYKAKVSIARGLFVEEMDETIKTSAQSGDLDAVKPLADAKAVFEESGTLPEVTGFAEAVGDYASALDAADEFLSEPSRKRSQPIRAA